MLDLKGGNTFQSVFLTKISDLKGFAARCEDDNQRGKKNQNEPGLQKTLLFSPAPSKESH